MFFNIIYKLFKKGALIVEAVFDGGVLGLFLYKNTVIIQGDNIIA